MALLVIIALIIVVWGALVWALRPDGRKSWREGLSGAQTLLGTFAVLIAVVWYFEQRPDAPKLKLDITTSAYTQPGNRAVAIVQIEMENIGETGLQFSNDRKLHLFLQHIKVAAPNGSAANNDPQLSPADNWTLISRFDEDLDTVIEAGERENYYYKAIFDCTGDKAFIVSARLSKPRKLYDMAHIGPAATPDNALWNRQAIIDITKACGDQDAKAKDDIGSRRITFRRPIRRSTTRTETGTS